MSCAARFKGELLDKAYEWFKAASANHEFDRFCRENVWWLNDFTLNIFQFFPAGFAYYFRRLCNIGIRQSEKRIRMASSNGRGATASMQLAPRPLAFSLKVHFDDNVGFRF